MKKLLLSLFAVTLLFTACKKESAPSTQATTKTAVTATPKNNVMAKNGRDASNTNNPYDNAGQDHNMILDEVKDYLIENENATEEDVIDFVNTFCSSYYGTTVDVEPYLDDEFSTSNPTVQGYINDLDDIINDIPSYTTYNTYKSAVISLESTISGDNTLSSSEKELLLGTASIARYSADYWWDNTPTSPSTDKRSDVVNADREGYLVSSHSFISATFSARQAYRDFMNWWNG